MASKWHNPKNSGRLIPEPICLPTMLYYAAIAQTIALGSVFQTVFFPQNFYLMKSVNSDPFGSWNSNNLSHLHLVRGCKPGDAVKAHWHSWLTETVR